MAVKKNLLALILMLTLSFLLIGCGEEVQEEVASNEGAADGIWMAEVYAGPGTMPSMVEGEFATYSTCIKAAREASESGIFSCGVRTAELTETE